MIIIIITVVTLRVVQATGQLNTDPAIIGREVTVGDVRGEMAKGKCPGHSGGAKILAPEGPAAGPKAGLLTIL